MAGVGPWSERLVVHSRLRRRSGLLAVSSCLYQHGYFALPSCHRRLLKEYETDHSPPNRRRASSRSGVGWRDDAQGGPAARTPGAVTAVHPPIVLGLSHVYRADAGEFRGAHVFPRAGDGCRRTAGARGLWFSGGVLVVAFDRGGVRVRCPTLFDPLALSPWVSRDQRRVRLPECRLCVGGVGRGPLMNLAMNFHPPAMHGVIDRRILVNLRVSPASLQAILPFPFQPRLIRGWGMAGICLIRLKQIRPLGLSARFGISSENAAHRIAVKWEAEGRGQEGVYIPRRDTSSRINAFAGGRL